MLHSVTVSFMAFTLFVSGTHSVSARQNYKGIFMERSFDQGTGRCRYFDRLYEEGQSIILDEKCDYQCTCYVSEYYEGFLCEPLCPRYLDNPCSPGWKNHPEMVSVGPPESGCFCSKPNCVPSDIEVFRLR